jgi:hypothetical protein
MSKIITDGIVNLNGFRFVPRRPLRSAERRRKPSTFPKRRNLPNYLFNRLGIDNGPDRKITLGFGEITENRPTHRRSNCLILLRRRRTNCQPLVNATPANIAREKIGKDRLHGPVAAASAAHQRKPNRPRSTCLRFANR